MIPRYSRPEMAALFSDEAKFGSWLEVEILACEAWAELGVVPACRRGRRSANEPGFDVAAIEERERVTDHDMAAFVDVVQERVGHARRRLGALRAHLDATSSTPRCAASS